MTTTQAKLMLDALKQDFADAWGSGNNTGHISLDIYKKKFNVSHEDIEVYCETLTPMKPLYPKCVMCSNEWYFDKEDDKIRPISNGHLIVNVDFIETFCCNNHDTIWYSQNKDGKCSFDREIEDLHGNQFSLRYNCDCMEPKCFGKNVIYTSSHEDHYGSYTDKILKCFDPPLPFDISHEDLWNKIEHLMVLI